MPNNIRIATENDLSAIVEIYNQAVRNKFETADTDEIELKNKLEWFENHKPDSYPILVYEKDNLIVGWISISPYREGRKALRFTVEISYYIHNRYKRQGIGSELIKHAIIESKKRNYKNLFAIILDKNKASINLLNKNGFVEWGHLPDIADFDGEECGHVYYGLKI